MTLSAILLGILGFAIRGLIDSWINRNVPKYRTIWDSKSNNQNGGK